MRATEECSGNLGSIFLIVFVFSVALSRCETIHLCIYFVVFPVNLIHLSWHHEFSFFLTQRLGIVGNSTSCPSLNSSYGNCYGEPESGKNRDFLHRVCLLSSGMIPRFSTMYPGKYFPRPMGWSWIFQTNQVMFRDVGKKKFSRLRYLLSRLTLEGACAFCVGAADTGGGGGPLSLGGSGGPPPGNFENLSSIWCPLVQSGDSFNAVNIH